MKHLILTLFLVGLFNPFLSGQEMHRKWGASVIGGVSVQTVSYKGENKHSGTVVKPGAGIGLNLRLRLSPKSSLQLSGSLALDRYTIQGHVKRSVDYYWVQRRDTTYSAKYFGNLEQERIYWQGVLAYRYTIDHRWGLSLGIRTEGLLRESGSFTTYRGESYRWVDGESTLVEAVEWEPRSDWYYVGEDREGGLQANVYCQLNRRLQLIASLDAPIPFIISYGYNYSRYKLMAGYRLF
ncbi:hypothetical protein FUA23_10625 [Neolewinella aurantiaca]|uniref:Uncharacterized protein n=1 Tax=Neolewinella aurantiaca TaxID=2602767 RepID=A0A5C7FV63_9BACT|nr:hypothetical protein [Neolewinella aurantiaca]TXF89412.1 hypothetical protein FUA23_10625 [Neolewinella aurantiaca]